MSDGNLNYRIGALWRTRTAIEATPHIFDTIKIAPGTKLKVKIPRGELILLLAYEMNANYEEHVAFLWKEQIYFAFNIDTGISFDLNPGNINLGTK